jgi:L-alanine-DL-glutamate epimerase-like enolase superfamily enzyme
VEITAVRSRVVELPLEGEFRPAWMRGQSQSSFLLTLVEVDTDEGITGVGAADAGVEAAIAIDRFVAPHLVGENPMEVERLTGVLQDAELMAPPLYCVELCLWDVVGKAAGLPVYKLWGGHKDRVPAYCSTGELRPPARRAEDVRALVDDGFRGVKLRFHHADPREDIEVVEAVRAAVGDEVELMVDANQAGVLPGLGGHERWNFHTALAVARELERLSVLWLEEPLPRHDYDGLARLRDRLHTLALAGGECNHGIHEFKLLIDRGCYDILQPDVVISEGAFQLWKVSALAEAAHLRLVPHTWTNGIGLVANLHLAAAIPTCDWLEFPHDPGSGWTAAAGNQMLADPPWIDADGCVRVPDRPGFGFDLDDELLDHHTVARFPS